MLSLLRAALEINTGRLLTGQRMYPMTGASQQALSLAACLPSFRSPLDSLHRQQSRFFYLPSISPSSIHHPAASLSHSCVSSANPYQPENLFPPPRTYHRASHISPEPPTCVKHVYFGHLGSWRQQPIETTVRYISLAQVPTPRTFTSATSIRDGNSPLR